MALTCLLAAPAVNPVVLVATAVAFPAEPGMVLARFGGSLATACVMGWLWQRMGRAEWIADRARRPVVAPEGANRWLVLAETARHDIVSAGGFLVLGALIAATLSVLVPPEWLDALAGQLLLAILVMAVLAVVLALCSEADAFVAASLSALVLLPRLAFLVVGPAVDVKLVALQAGAFGRGFAARFAPLTFVLLVVLGGALLRITADDTHLRYVRPAHKWLLLGAGVVIVCLGVVALVRDLRASPADEGPGYGEPHAHGSVESSIPWLLLLPSLVISLVAPPALGADAVSRAGSRNAVVQAADVFGPLPEGPAPELSLAEFVLRASSDTSGSLDRRE